MKRLLLLTVFTLFCLTSYTQNTYHFYIKITKQDFKKNNRTLSLPYSQIKELKPLYTQQTNKLLQKRGVSTKTHPLKEIYRITYLSQLSTEAIRYQLSVHPNIKDFTIVPVAYPLSTPNDPLSNLSRSPIIFHDFSSAFDIEPGDSNLVIGIVDTGVLPTHEDLKNKIKHNYADTIDGVNNDDDTYFGQEITDNFSGWDIADFDNTPYSPATAHGTEVASIVSAEANNGKGMAGTGGNCMMLPIKVVQDATPNSITHGYDGMLYAAEHGAKVINCSWGYEAESLPTILTNIIRYIAVDLDVVIVAAGGNAGNQIQYQPASSEYVLGVTTILEDSTMWGFTTYNTDIDIIALGGRVSLANTSTDSSYTNDWGSSLATPVVSGAAALLRSHNPSLTAEQVIQRLRITGTRVDSLYNPKYTEKIGTMLNPTKALLDSLSPALRIVDIQYNNEIIGNGDTVEISYRYLNYLHNSPVVVASISSKDTLSIVMDTSLSIAPINTLDTSGIYISKIFIPAFTDTIYTNIRTGFSSINYLDYQYKKLMFKKTIITSTKNTLSTNNQLIIFPNPAKISNKIYINDDKNHEISLYSLDGKLLYINTIQSNFSLPQHLKTGTYILIISDNTNIFRQTLTLY